MKALSKNKLYYLASPYSYISPKNTLFHRLKSMYIRHKRFKQVTEAAVKLIQAGYTCLEPIAMCHYKSLRYTLPSGYKFWKTRDRWFIRKCDGIIILTLSGWKESEGVQDELNYARSLGKDVVFMNYGTWSTMKETRKRVKKTKLTTVTTLKVSDGAS